MCFGEKRTSKTDSSPNTYFFSLRTFSHNLLSCKEICQYLPFSWTSLSPFEWNKSRNNSTFWPVFLTDSYCFSVGVKRLFRGWTTKHGDERLIEMCGQPDDLIPWTGDSLLSESNELIPAERSWFFSFLQSVSDVRLNSLNITRQMSSPSVSLKSPKGHDVGRVLAVPDAVWVCVQDWDECCVGATAVSVSSVCFGPKTRIKQIDGGQLLTFPMSDLWPVSELCFEL